MEFHNPLPLAFRLALLARFSAAAVATPARSSAQKKTQRPLRRQPAPRRVPSNRQHRQVNARATGDHRSAERLSKRHAELPRRRSRCRQAGLRNAVDLMLTSGLDLKTSPQLSDEFEHIVDAVNALEMDALKQGNGFAAPMEQRRSASPTMSPSPSIRISALPPKRN